MIPTSKQPKLRSLETNPHPQLLHTPRKTKNHLWEKWQMTSGEGRYEETCCTYKLSSILKQILSSSSSSSSSVQANCVSHAGDLRIARATRATSSKPTRTYSAISMHRQRQPRSVPAQCQCFFFFFWRGQFCHLAKVAIGSIGRFSQNWLKNWI
jgi:hypothetical protein